MTTKHPFTPKTTKTGKTVNRDISTLVVKAQAHKVVINYGNGTHWDVLVGSGTSGETYEVTVAVTNDVTEGATRGDIVATCTCDYGAHRPDGAICSHTVAAIKATVGAGKNARFYTSAGTVRRAHRPVHYTGDNVWVAL